MSRCSVGTWTATTAVLLLLAGVATAAHRDAFYPHGDTKLPTDQDDASSPEIALKVPIVFYGEVFNSIYVNSNGLLSFSTDIPSFISIQFPLDYAVIAPLYTNVDTRGGGAVYFRETQDELLLRRAEVDVRAAFASGAGFNPTSLFIASWLNVGYFKEGSDKHNSFQAVIATDGTDSYLMFVYADGGIQWIQGSGLASGLPDARAQAGVVASDGRLYTLRGSGSDQVQNLDKWSNIGRPGIWLFHIGQTGPTGNIGQPDLIAEVAETSEVAPKTTCRMRSTECHSKATCRDYETGFCCACQQGYYGNGINCLKDGIPNRVNGKVSGIVNGIEISQLDLQSYVVTTDGRTYTAVSRVPEEIGFDMQTLNILGGLIGWLFAKPVGKATNGYQRTGGVLNQTADITFKGTGEMITVIQQYTGLDVFDHLRMEAHVRGSLPKIPSNVKLQLADYEEQYTSSERGVVYSHSTQSYRLGDSPDVHSFTVEQYVQFEECVHAQQEVAPLRLKVSRNFFSYEARETIVRYAMTGKVVPLGEDDPCKEGLKKCGPHSSCYVEADTFKCACNRGFHYLYDVDAQTESAVCVDINECTLGTTDCDPMALCINEAGSFSCQCPQGFTGNGRECTKIITCRDLNCHPDADCITSRSGALLCQCRAGFQGDGSHCTPRDIAPRRACDVYSDCSPFGVCTPSADTFHCVCLPGYEGDGYSCKVEDLPEDTSPISVLVPTCSAGSCWCPADYQLVGQECIRDTYERETSQLFSRPEPICYVPQKCSCPRGYDYNAVQKTCHPRPGTPHSPSDTMGPSGSHLSCNILNTCHPYAQCVYVQGRHACRCNAGYTGDGYECHGTVESCLQADICHSQATCTLQDNADTASCMCNPGYTGDGTQCTRIEECRVDEDCEGNARCLWAARHARHECLCEEGFRREGALCLLQLPAGCNLVDDCDANAHCVFSAADQEHVCHCNAGYSGDGKSCSPLVVACNVLNQCGQGAECVYQQEAAGYRCQCRPGYRGSNGVDCRLEVTCLEQPYLCGPDASCVAGPRGGHACKCNSGFTGNGVTCKAATKFPGNFLLVNQGMATLRIPFEPTPSNPGRTIAIQYDQVAIGIDVDCQEGRVYWCDVTGSTIKSSNYDGSNVTSFITEDISSPEGVSIDWVSRNIYWTDSSKDTVEMAHLITKERKVIVSQGLVNPRGIAVYPAIGKVFWSDWNREAPKLEWANLDGSGRAVFLKGPSVKLPNSLAIDFLRDELCYADAGSKQIECVGISSGVKRTIATNCNYPFGLTITPENYYWTDWETRKIESAKRPSGPLNKPISVPLGGSGKLYGIIAVPETCPR